MTKQITLSILTWLLISVTTLTILFYIIPVSAPPPPTTRRVPQDYLSIQAAIDDSRAGDIILVSPGIYYENVVVNKAVKLMGVNKDTTIIDAKQVGNVIKVVISTVTITGFTIRNGNNGIRVDPSTDPDIGNINITGNIIKNNRYGVSLSADYPATTANNIISLNTFQNNSNVGISISFGLSNTISKNDISESAYGMKLLTNTTTISDNLLKGNSYGIWMSSTANNNLLNNIGIDNSYCIYAAYSDHILIRNNKVNGSTFGIQLYGGYSNTILYNTVSNNPRGWGIYLAYSKTNSVTNNTMSRNDWGLILYNSSLNTIDGNTISYNTFGITTNSYSSNNKIYHNNFMSNVDQISQDSTCTNRWWTTTTPYQGNYWSDYRGTDTNGDGIGDTLTPHLGVDYYPLMNTWPIPKRDVAILGVYESMSRAYIGQIINFEVIVKNEGPNAETFNVTLQNNVTLIEERTVTGLAAYTNTTLIFNWNTSAVLPGYYLISATAEPVSGETDLGDNSKTDGTINLKEPLLGDISIPPDFIVDENDLIILNQAFGSTEGPPPSGNWNSNADLNEDNIIDVQDLLLLSQNYGKTA